MRVKNLEGWPKSVPLPKGYKPDFIKKVFGVLTGPKKNPTKLALIFIDRLDRVQLFRNGKRTKVRTNGTPGLRVEKACFDLTLELMKEGWQVR